MKYLKIYESFDKNYEKIDYNIYAQSRNKLNSIPFTEGDINTIQSVVKGEVKNVSGKKGHKTRHMVRIEGLVPFLGSKNKPVLLYITISKYEDEWFYVHITISMAGKVIVYSDPQSIEANEQSFWKCDQLDSVISLIKNEILVEI